MPSMLIVDDDLHLRKLVLTYAQMENYQCREAEDGDQALSLLREAEADIIILDLMMPGKDGFETLGELRQFTQAPVIMLTARSEEYDKLLGFNLGADDYVPKPFSPKELMARAGAVLKRTGGQKRTAGLAFGGLSIQKEARAIIWERYQRSQHQAGRRQGTGIGLSIVKTILDAHGMTCGVDCRDGLTCFWFRYPANPA